MDAAVGHIDAIDNGITYRSAALVTEKSASILAGNAITMILTA